MDGRELYVSLIGNGDDARDPARSPRWSSTSGRRRPRSGSPPSPPSGTRTTAPARESGTSLPARIAASVRERIEDDLPDRLPGALAPRLRAARRATRARRRGLVSRGQRQPLHQLRARHGERGGEGRDGLLPISSSGWWTRRWPAMSARKRTRQRGPVPELRCVCGQRLAAILALLLQLRPRAAAGGDLDSVTGAECYQLRLDRLGQVLLVPLVRRGHLRGGLLQRGARSRRRRDSGWTPAATGAAAAACSIRCAYCPWCGRPQQLERGRTCSRATAPTAAAGWTTG